MKTYISNDNSYALNLTKGNQEHYYLAGTLTGEQPKEAVIVSEPYTQTVESVVKGYKELTFINVEYKSDTIRVLFREENVGADLHTRIARNKQRTAQSRDYLFI